MKYNTIKIFALILMVLFVNVSLASANDVTRVDDGTVSIKADAEHLKILNELKGTEISYGELIEKVFPEAIKDTPKEILENQYKIPYIWNTESAVEPVTIDSGGGKVNTTSYLGPSFNPLDFHSSTTVLPYGLHTFDYLSVLSFLEYHPIGDSEITIKASEYDYGYDTLRVNASGEWDGFNYGGYRTHGSHYIEDAETVPNVTTKQTFTDWLYLTN